jgi:hypothetical protein
MVPILQEKQSLFSIFLFIGMGMNSDQQDLNY